jgi:hypothetical protein
VGGRDDSANEHFWILRVDGYFWIYHGLFGLGLLRKDGALLVADTSDVFGLCYIALVLTGVCVGVVT